MLGQALMAHLSSLILNGEAPIVKTPASGAQGLPHSSMWVEEKEYLANIDEINKILRYMLVHGVVSARMQEAVVVGSAESGIVNAVHKITPMQLQASGLVSRGKYLFSPCYDSEHGRMYKVRFAHAGHFLSDTDLRIRCVSSDYIDFKFSDMFEFMGKLPSFPTVTLVLKKYFGWWKVSSTASATLLPEVPGFVNTKTSTIALLQRGNFVLLSHLLNYYKIQCHYKHIQNNCELERRALAGTVESLQSIESDSGYWRPNLAKDNYEIRQANAQLEETEKSRNDMEKEIAELKLLLNQQAEEATVLKKRVAAVNAKARLHCQLSTFQACVRMRKQRSVYLETIGKCVRIQKFYKLRRKVKATIIFQKYTLKHHFRTRYLLTKRRVIFLQSLRRMGKVRKRYLAKRSAVISIQSMARKRIDKKSYSRAKQTMPAHLRMQYFYALKIQSFYRMWSAMKQYDAIVENWKRLQAAIVLQKDYRRYSAMKQYDAIVENWKRLQAAIVLQKNYRRYSAMKQQAATEKEAVVYKYKVGDRVSATMPNFNGDWFDGNITKLVKDGTAPRYVVTFDDNDVETIEEDKISLFGSEDEGDHEENGDKEDGKKDDKNKIDIVYKYKVGDRVSATMPNFNGDWFDGNITKLVKDGTAPRYVVTFDDNDVETIEEDKISLFGSEDEGDHEENGDKEDGKKDDKNKIDIVYKYKVGDRVSATMPNFNGDWFDGNITKLVKDGTAPRYVVTFDDNDVETIEEDKISLFGSEDEDDGE
eukprot:g4655.t1